MKLTVSRITEATAVLLNLIYTYLYLQQSEWCFLFGGVGSSIFVWLCYSKKIYGETLLQVFYVAAAVYGYLHFYDNWTSTNWSFNKQLPFVISAIVLGGISAWLLKKYTDAKLPLADSLVTAFSMLATGLMVNYVHENWLYWIVIDAVCIFIYLHRKLYMGAVLFVVYLLMAIDGFFKLGWV